MRTKSLLAAAALVAAGITSSMAQANVYSLNVVGYVNVVVEGGGKYNMIANPLNNTTSNGSTNLFSTPNNADGATILKWDPATFNFQGTFPTYFTEFGVWDQSVNLPVGEAFFYVNPGATFTNTFVGEVVQGTFNNPVSGSGAYNAVGSSAPIGGVYTNAIAGLVPTDGDTILAWDPNTFNFQGTFPTYFTEFGVWDNTTAPTIKVGEGFFYVRTGSPTTWARNFTVQ